MVACCRQVSSHFKSSIPDSWNQTTFQAARKACHDRLCRTRQSSQGDAPRLLVVIESAASAASGAPAATFDKPQRAQNNLARVVCQSRGRTDTWPLLRSLHSHSNVSQRAGTDSMHQLGLCALPMLQCWSFLAYTPNWPGPLRIFFCCSIHLELSTCWHSTVRKHYHFQTPLENPSNQTHLVLLYCIKRLCIFGPKDAIQIRYYYYYYYYVNDNHAPEHLVQRAKLPDTFPLWQHFWVLFVFDTAIKI